ncbi:class I SAM-dependent methyltransferase [Streptomyces sp. ODS28]|uniref:class I SAM-dependent methyltransferase n=1 Tax=Streptomyces sp. ODS28 TaxID=3136688 RepID=UPI0031F17187
MSGVQEYYAREAGALAERYEGLSFEAVHHGVLGHLPEPPARALDVGAGTGRDAAALARRGFEVVAVEPVPQLRAVARRLHAEAPVTWIDDALPTLEKLTGPYDLILLSAVWMHLEEGERALAMSRLSALTAPDGRLVLTLRHGPPPPERRMFDVPAGETIELAERCGFTLVHQGTDTDQLGRAEVHWSELVLRKVGT